MVSTSQYFNRPGGKERLSKQLERAVHHVGFFYVKNFGLAQEQIDRQFTLAKHFFELPTSEKEKYEVNYAEADYNGWRRPGRSLVAQAKDNIEIYNIPKFIDELKGKYDQPDLLKAHLSEIETFQKGPALQHEDYLANQHSYDRNSTDHFRYMIYHSRTKDQWAEAKNGATGGHTDLGTLTLLFRQPVTGLQILGEDGSWTWVSAQPGTITGSPVLEAAGVRPRFDKIVTSEEWVRAKQRLQLNPEIAAKRWAERGDGTVEVLVGLRDQRYKE
ncbi:Clavaminate synthase-like protein [Lizonia empirigonia]|nr:Clavaminate synthase-like protein [Lizonia empirigonia]